ncbi:hypothetical protein [Meiothermus sp. QL-1]|nr:hypothetical protein [Meiothermus sp. QL-1]
MLYTYPMPHNAKRPAENWARDLLLDTITGILAGLLILASALLAPSA